MTHATFAHLERVVHAVLLVAIVAVSLAALTIALQGCAPSHYRGVYLSAPPPASLVVQPLEYGPPRHTAAGVMVSFPTYLDRYPSFEAQALLEVDATVATQLPGEPVWPAGVPVGWSVVVELPVFVVQFNGAPLSVRGATDLEHHVIYVGTRLDDANPVLLSALNWELGIARRGFEPASVTQAIPPIGGPS